MSRPTHSSSKLRASARCSSPTLLPEVCGQYHADLHWGEDAAQKNVFPAAQKVADWAHFTGACTRSAVAKKHPAAGDEKFTAFRKGVWVTAKNHLSPAGRTLMPLIERAFYCMRSVPTALLFHSISHSFFRIALVAEPSSPPEEAAAKALFRYYFHRVPAAEAREQCGLSTWVGDESFIYLFGRLVVWGAAPATRIAFRNSSARVLAQT